MLIKNQHCIKKHVLFTVVRNMYHRYWDICFRIHADCRSRFGKVRWTAIRRIVSRPAPPQHYFGSNAPEVVFNAGYNWKSYGHTEKLTQNQICRLGWGRLYPPPYCSPEITPRFSPIPWIKSHSWDVTFKSMLRWSRLCDLSFRSNKQSFNTLVSLN